MAGYFLPGVGTAPFAARTVPAYMEPSMNRLYDMTGFTAIVSHGLTG